MVTTSSGLVSSDVTGLSMDGSPAASEEVGSSSLIVTASGSCYAGVVVSRRSLLESSSATFSSVGSSNKAAPSFGEAGSPTL